MINITKYRLVYYIFSGLLIIASIIALVILGLNLGLDFKGGSLIEGGYSKILPENNRIIEILKKNDINESVVQKTQGNNFIVRFQDIDETKHQDIKTALDKLGKEISTENSFFELSFESLGPSVGKELRDKTFYAIGLVLLLIAAYVAYAFRKVSYPLKSWKYGVATLITLFHDVVIPLGVFAFLSHYKNVEINISFVAAILTVLGYSVHDTIIVFDRIRENLLKFKSLAFEEVINKSLRQTFIRSINTSLTVIFVLLAIYFFGGESIKYFALALLIGIGTGTYSSIFIASPLLLSWHNWTLKHKNTKTLKH